MNLQTIESADFNIGKLFGDFYTVPTFQREYVWGGDQVQQLLDDVLAEYAGDGGEQSEYFIGSIVVCTGSDGVYELIDGQQRMTTAYTLLCAIRDRLKEINQSASVDALRGMIASTSSDAYGIDVYRYRLTLQYEDSQNILKIIADGQD